MSFIFSVKTEYLLNIQVTEYPPRKINPRKRDHFMIIVSESIFAYLIHMKRIT